MQPSQWDIVILKPTAAFQNFLASQLSDFEVPDLRLLQTDTTAYVIKKYENEEDTLEEIEKHAAQMFRHEICRWLGDEAQNAIEASFLDFLCCFKFEMHSQIILMESSMEEGKNLLCIKPRSVFLRWMKAQVDSPDEEMNLVLEKVEVSHLAENATVLIKNFNEMTEIKPFVHQYYRAIFKTEMLRMCDQADYWPQVNSFADFGRYFAIEYHTQLIHLH